MAGRKLSHAAEARECLAAASASGRSRADWAQEHGVDARSLNAWRLNLARARPPTPMRLVELVASAAPPPVTVRCGAFEVVVPTHFDDEHVARVLRLVAGC